MPMELKGIADKQTGGMSTRVVFKLSAAPNELWIDTFAYAPGISVTSYPREMFHFEADTVSVTFMGPKLEEAYQTLTLYIADANKKVEKAYRKKRAPREALNIEKEKRRQTESLSRELFGDDSEPPKL